MNRFQNITGLLLACILITGFKVDDPTTKGKSVAVVELFTSEGCSSCPAADELLKEMTDLFHNEGKEVIGLSFHVTYWNKQGWIDPYSKDEFTERQKKYASVLNLDQLYTPQAIVNGTQEFAGSNPIAFRQGVEFSIAQASSFEIQATARVINEGGKLAVAYSVNKEPKSAILNVVLAERHVKHIVTRGENKNRTLTHYNVVKDLNTMELKKQDTVLLNIDKDWQRDNSEIVLYIQHKKTMRVLGATKITFQ